ncbi:FtsX-like permease family protein [Limosilactobacillus panis]|nr:ABC transporter permease [Limosilactobacillus panis]
MLFIRLINSSFKRNLRTYSPYLLATCMLVAINYIFTAIAANHSLKALSTGKVTTAMMKPGAAFILMVTAAFLLYVNHFLWQQRSREIGLYSMLGMTSRNLDLLTVLEKAYLLFFSLVGGLIGGIIFEKLAFLGLGRLLQVQHLRQSWISSGALLQTVMIFVAFFVVLMLVDLLKIHHLKPTDLWNSATATHKHHGPLFTIAGLIGLVTLAGAYYITLTTKPKITAINHFFLAVILVVIGTYLIFIAGSVILLNWLKKRRNFYYQPRHFIAVSGMRQRMEQNGAALATICLLCSSVLVILFTAVTLYCGISSTARSYTPKDITIVNNQPLTKHQGQVLKDTARQHHATVTDLTHYEATAPQVGYWRGHSFVNQGTIDNMTTATSNSMIFVTAKTYQRLTHHHTVLKGNQALIYAPGKKHTGRLVVGGKSYRVTALKKLNFAFNPDHAIFSPIFMVVNKLPKGMPTMTVTTLNYHLNGNAKKRIAFETALQQKLHLSSLQFSGYATIFSLLNGLYGGLVFIGILISIALGITTTIVIYFKQISEGYADKQRFTTMQEVGLSERETTKSIHSQVLMVFMLPIIGAIINFAFAFPAIKQIMTQLNFYSLTLMVAIAVIITVALLLLYLVIYGLTTRTYHQIIDK